MNPDFALAQSPATITLEVGLGQPADLTDPDIETSLHGTNVSQPDSQGAVFTEVSESSELSEPSEPPNSLVPLKTPPEHLKSPSINPEQMRFSVATSLGLEAVKQQLQAGDYEEAVNGLRRQLRQAPKNRELQQLLGEAYLLRANLTEAQSLPPTRPISEPTASAMTSKEPIAPDFLPPERPPRALSQQVATAPEPGVETNSAESVNSTPIPPESAVPEPMTQGDEESQVVKVLDESLRQEKKEDAERQRASYAQQSYQSTTTYEGYWKVNSKAFQSITKELKFRSGIPNVQQQLQVGVEVYEKEGIEDIRNLPIRLGIERKVNDTHLAATVGADIFQESRTTPYLELKARTQASPSLTAFGTVTHERYKDDAAVIRNQVSRWSIAPAIYWQLDPSTSLYAGYSLNQYSDNNIEQEASLEAKRKIGNFFVAASGFYESFSDTTASNYFAPSYYWLYGGELGWEGQVSRQSNIKLSATAGQQQYPVGFQPFWVVKSSWQQQISKNSSFEFQYRYSRQAPYPGNIQDEHEHSLLIEADIRF